MLCCYTFDAKAIIVTATDSWSENNNILLVGNTCNSISVLEVNFSKAFVTKAAYSPKFYVVQQDILCMKMLHVNLPYVIIITKSKAILCFNAKTGEIKQITILSDTISDNIKLEYYSSVIVDNKCWAVFNLIGYNKLLCLSVDLESSDIQYEKFDMPANSELYSKAVVYRDNNKFYLGAILKRVDLSIWLIEQVSKHDSFMHIDRELVKNNCSLHVLQYVDENETPFIVLGHTLGVDILKNSQWHTQNLKQKLTQQKQLLIGSINNTLSLDAWHLGSVDGKTTVVSHNTEKKYEINQDIDAVYMRQNRLILLSNCTEVLLQQQDNFVLQHPDKIIEINHKQEKTSHVLLNDRKMNYILLIWQDNKVKLYSINLACELPGLLYFYLE